jgi:hypothetical protein
MSDFVNDSEEELSQMVVNLCEGSILSIGEAFSEGRLVLT